MLTQAILRGFGANKVLDVRHSLGRAGDADGEKIDILLCDSKLPPDGGFWLTRAIRRNTENENRTMPIDHEQRHPGGDDRIARDVGANMVVAMPIRRRPSTIDSAWVAPPPAVHRNQNLFRA